MAQVIQCEMFISDLAVVLGFECALSRSIRRTYFDSSDNSWRVTEELLDEIEGDLQSVIDCAMATSADVRVAEGLFIEVAAPIAFSGPFSIIGEGNNASIPTLACAGNDRILRIR